MIDPALRDESPQITDRLLRQFGALCLLIFGGLAVIELYGRHRAAPAAGFLALAGIGVAGLIRPRAIHLFFYAAMAFTWPIGWAISRILLAAMFYLLFTPIALMFRLSGRDALGRRFNPRAATYWRKRSQPSEIRGYLHQS